MKVRGIKEVPQNHTEIIYWFVLSTYYAPGNGLGLVDPAALTLTKLALYWHAVELGFEPTSIQLYVFYCYILLLRSNKLDR